VLLILGSDSHALQAYNSPTGVSILAMGAGVCVAAYRLMMRIARLPADKRVLA
jgi:tight adherence protein B